MPEYTTSLRLLLVADEKHNPGVLEESFNRCGIDCTIDDVRDEKDLTTALVVSGDAYDIALMDGELSPIAVGRVARAVNAQGLVLPLAVLADENADDDTLRGYAGVGAFVLMKRHDYQRLMPFGLRAIVHSGAARPHGNQPVAGSERREQQARIIESVLSNWERQQVQGDKRFACSSLTSGVSRRETSESPKLVPFPSLREHDG